VHWNYIHTYTHTHTHTHTREDEKYEGMEKEREENERCDGWNDDCVTYVKRVIPEMSKIIARTEGADGTQYTSGQGGECVILQIVTCAARCVDEAILRQRSVLSSRCSVVVARGVIFKQITECSHIECGE
jgi:hypothetical protein